MPTTYSTEWFAGHASGSRSSAIRILPHILEYIAVNSALDVGCGVGAWAATLAKLGVQDVLGIDGDYVDRSQLEIPLERFVPRDLSEGFSLGRKFDLVISVEVAEHLPERSADLFVATLGSHAQRAVLFSAAIPGQGGNGHVNEQWPDYWAAKFRQNGFVVVDCIRHLVWTDPRVESFYAQNTILFVRDPIPDRLRERVVDDLLALRVVHPRQWAKFRPPPPSRKRRLLESALGERATARMRELLGR